MEVIIEVKKGEAPYKIIRSSKSTSQYSVAKNTKIGIFWLKIKKWLEL